MYGAECVAVVIDTADSLKVALKVIAQGSTQEERQGLAEALTGSQRDDMGLGQVIYWPGLPWETPPPEAA
jgi:hypothetical protein